MAFFTVLSKKRQLLIVLWLKTLENVIIMIQWHLIGPKLESSQSLPWLNRLRSNIDRSIDVVPKKKLRNNNWISFKYQIELKSNSCNDILFYNNYIHQLNKSIFVGIQSDVTFKYDSSISFYLTCFSFCKEWQKIANFESEI